MRVIRFVLFGALVAFAWRVLRGRGRQVVQRSLGRLGHPADHVSRGSVTAHGTHTSAASAANEPYRDDRDVTVGENLSAIGMRPGGI